MQELNTSACPFLSLCPLKSRPVTYQAISYLKPKELAFKFASQQCDIEFHLGILRHATRNNDLATSIGQNQRLFGRSAYKDFFYTLLAHFFIFVTCRSFIIFSEFIKPTFSSRVFFVYARPKLGTSVITDSVYVASTFLYHDAGAKEHSLSRYTE